jgi:hypothetical protein
VTTQYLIGELSVRLERLEAVAASDACSDVAGLRREVETGPTSGLAPAAVKAIELADSLCWQSLSRGDITTFTRQAEILADLHLFGICARLLRDS